MIVFDFDRTLINNDTLFGFYRAANKGGFIFKLKHFVLVGAAILYKLRFLSNDSLKALGVFLFLRGKKHDDLHQVALRYCKKLNLNDIYYSHYLETDPDKRLIISASLDIYLTPLFSKENLLASSLNFKNGRVSSLAFNCYADAKVIRFNRKYPGRAIEGLYTDSFSDAPLIRLAKHTFIVKNGKIKSQVNYL